MDAKMDDMQAEMDATFAAKFGDSSDAVTDSDNSDTTVDWSWTDDTTDTTSDLDREMDDMQEEMDAKFAFFGSSDADDGTSDNSDSTDDTRDDTNDDTTDDSNTDWNNDGSSDDTTGDDSTDRNSGDSSDGTTDDSDSQPSSLEEATEQKLHELINNERRQRGLQPFNWDSGLAETADYKSSDMASRSYFAHTSPTGESFRDIYSRFGYNCRIPYGGTIYLGGENIARTWFDRDVRADHGGIVHYDTANELADGLRRQWMTSDPHRKAILRPYYENHGLGVEITDDGRVYATEHFC